MLIEASEPSSLAPKDREAVDRAAAAWYRGDPVSAVQVLSPLVARLDETKLAAAEKLLAERKVPSLGQILGQARLRLVEQGLAADLPKVQAREAALVLPALAEQVAETRKLQRESRVMAEPLPVAFTIGEYEELL